MFEKNIKHIKESISLLKWNDLIILVLIIFGIILILFKLFPQMCNYTPCSNSELFAPTRPLQIRNSLEIRQKPQRSLQESDELEERIRTRVQVRTRVPVRTRAQIRKIPKYKIGDIITNICEECKKSPNKISECKQCKIYTNYISSRKDFMNLRKELIKNRKKKKVSINLEENEYF